MAPTNRYDPATYWNDREDPNSKLNKALPKRIEEYVVKHLPSDGKVLEFGPGVGRLFSLFSGRHIDTLDISKKYKKALEDQARQYNVELNQYHTTSADDSFPFRDGSYSLSIACQVLIHVPFEVIKHTVSELARVSDAVLIVSGNSENWPKSPQEINGFVHCFSHDYLELSRELGLQAEDVHHNPEMMILRE